MNDLISRQSATKLFENMVSDATSHGISPLRLSPDYVISGIEALPSAQQWIPCSERLPEKNGDYIVSLEDCVYPWASWFNGKWFMLPIGSIARDFGEHEILAWMPLPEPYKEK